MRQVIIAQTTELADGQMRKISVENRDILLVRTQGAYYAVDNKCTHLGGSLAEGNLNGGSVVCPKHGTAFDLATGTVSHGGKIAFIKVNPKPLRTYPVTIEGTNILVELD